MKFEWKNLLDKAWWRSKTIWFNVLFAGFASFVTFATPLIEMLPEATATSVMGVLMMIQGYGNIVLRFLTKHGLIPAKDELAQKQEVAKVEMLNEAIGDIPAEDIPALKEAAAAIKLQKDVDAAQKLLASVNLAKQGAAEAPKA